MTRRSTSLAGLHPLDEGMILVAFPSHRARQYGLRAIGRKATAYCYYDWARRVPTTAKGGAYAVTRKELETLKVERERNSHRGFNMNQFSVIRDPKPWGRCLFG